MPKGTPYSIYNILPPVLTTVNLNDSSSCLLYFFSLVIMHCCISLYFNRKIFVLTGVRSMGRFYENLIWNVRYSVNLPLQAASGRLSSTRSRCCQCASGSRVRLSRSRRSSGGPWTRDEPLRSNRRHFLVKQKIACDPFQRCQLLEDTHSIPITVN